MPDCAPCGATFPDKQRRDVHIRDCPLRTSHEWVVDRKTVRVYRGIVGNMLVWKCKCPKAAASDSRPCKRVYRTWHAMKRHIQAHVTTWNYIPENVSNFCVLPSVLYLTVDFQERELKQILEEFRAKNSPGPALEHSVSTCFRHIWKSFKIVFQAQSPPHDPSAGEIIDGDMDIDKARICFKHLRCTVTDIPPMFSLHLLPLHPSYYIILEAQ